MNKRLTHHCFSFGDAYSDSHGVYITDIKIDGSPQRDVSFETVAGRNGDLIIDNNRWKNLKITYSCAIGSGFANRLDEFKFELLSKSGYHKLVDNIYPGMYRMAMIKDPIDIEFLRGKKVGRFDITFYCKPQKFLEAGDYVSNYSCISQNECQRIGAGGKH